MKTNKSTLMSRAHVISNNAEHNPIPEERRIVKIEFYKDGEHVVLSCDCDTIEEAFEYAVKRGAAPLDTIRYTFAA